jgi:putative adhesin
MLVGTAALVYALAVTATAAQERPARAPQTDQTVPVSRGTRLAVDNYAGEVVIHTWDKDALRVQARHQARTRVNIRAANSAVSVSASTPGGPNGSVDYDIMVPAWMPMKVEGQYNYVTIDGAQGDVTVVSVRGDIILKGGSGPVSAKTIEGEIVVEGARGKVELRSVNEGIKVTGASGDITAETTNGDITLARIESGNVSIGTVNGDIAYDGRLADNGHYSFTTHNGDVLLTLPDSANATFNIRTYSGDFNTNLPLKGPDRSEARRGKRLAYTLGTGSADVEMESFGGSLRVRRTTNH